MTDLFWPGDHRAGDLLSDAAFLAAMAGVESAWVGALVDVGVAPPSARMDFAAMVSSVDVEQLAEAAEADGSPVKALVALLRGRAGGEAATWLHRGLTSQDVVDTALILCLRDALTRLRGELSAQVRTLTGLAETHHSSAMTARTLTQPALPSTIGVKIGNWLSGVLDAADTLDALPALPAQAGGAAGTLAATTELTGSPVDALAVSDALACALDLAPALPWHTTRSVITRAGDALVGCCDAFAHIATDVATASRPEIGELSEGRGGGSSTMPHKSNPVLSVLIRRAAMTAPALGAALHTASAASVDERSDGGWQAEWATLRTLARRTVVAAAQTTDLLTGLRIDVERAAANMAAAGDLRGEQKAMTELTGLAPRSEYLGATEEIVRAVLQRARHHLEETT
ncbi:lyase family protein [Mycolicibacterium stellerae]|uniref:lyase family protein n=1 Tax=Mycolicibacterium stellerae TaxID=2358193 RepID=UPI000F0BB014|nr:lyase family protein [Mycolicibacterium stellerae]